jgi:hypothetical protein
MATAFTLSVAVQVNDPDSVWWMALYGAAALVAGWEAARPGRVPIWLVAVVGAVALGWAGWLAMHASPVAVPELFAAWEMKNERVEIGREIGGLLIVAVWMAVTWGTSRPGRAHASGPAGPAAPRS